MCMYIICQNPHTIVIGRTNCYFLIFRFIFANAPVSLKNQNYMDFLYYYAAIYAQKRPVPLRIFFPKSLPTNVLELSNLCIRMSILDMYIWLSIHFPGYFIEQQRCIELKEHGLKMIQSTLNSQMHDAHSHSGTYSKKQQYLEVCEEGIPFLVSEEIRELMKEFLIDVPRQDWVKYPHQDLDLLSQTALEQILNGY